MRVASFRQATTLADVVGSNDNRFPSSSVHPPCRCRLLLSSSSPFMNIFALLLSHQHNLLTFKIDEEEGMSTFLFDGKDHSGATGGAGKPKET